MTLELDEVRKNNPDLTRADVIEKLKAARAPLRQCVEAFFTPEQLTKWNAEVAKAKEFLGLSPGREFGMSLGKEKPRSGDRSQQYSERRPTPLVLLADAVAAPAFFEVEMEMTLVRGIRAWTENSCEFVTRRSAQFLQKSESRACRLKSIGNPDCRPVR
jgi:hypothetical protein